MEAKEMLSRAKAKLVLDYPFFATLVLGMNMVEDKDCPTACTNGRQIRYNPDFVKGLTINQVVGLLAHEGGHVGLLHHVRRQSREPRRFNVAADMVLNPILKESGFELPTSALMGKLGEYVEEVYARLPEEPKGCGNGKEGTCWGEVEDAPGAGGGKANQAEMAAAEQDAKIRIVQAMNQSKNCGKVPAGIARLVEEILEPRIDWKQLFRNLIDQVARNDYNWQTPNRRFINSGIYLPSLKSRELGTVVVAEDTSGSVGQKAINQFNRETSSILEEYDTTVWLLPCDVKVHNPQEFTRYDLPLKAKVCGGGGTSFVDPFRYVNENDLNPTVLVYLTDGWCSEYPDFTPDFPVIWITTQNKIQPPWGEVIVMNIDD